MLCHLATSKHHEISIKSSNCMMLSVYTCSKLYYHNILSTVKITHISKKGETLSYITNLIFSTYMRYFEHAVNVYVSIKITKYSCIVGWHGQNESYFNACKEYGVLHRLLLYEVVIVNSVKMTRHNAHN